MRYPNGLFGWADLMTRDTATAAQFYDALFGWTHVEQPTPMGPAYTEFFKDGRLVCGMSPMMPGVPEQVSAFWNAYVLVEDLDATLDRVLPAHGSVSMPAMDVMNEGRMAMVTDPSGATVGLWEPRDHQGADVFNEPGSMTWNELQSRDVDAALPFYDAVFGWTWRTQDGSDYWVAELPAKQDEDKTNAGAMAMPPGVPDEVSSLWMVYFAVDDCDTSLAAAQELGGQVFLPAMRMDQGTFGGVADPTGGMFFVYS